MISSVPMSDPHPRTKSSSATRTRSAVIKASAISSTSGVNGNPGQVNYSSAKAGIMGLTKTLALETARSYLNAVPRKTVRVMLAGIDVHGAHDRVHITRFLFSRDRRDRGRFRQRQRLRDLPVRPPVPKA